MEVALDALGQVLGQAQTVLVHVLLLVGMVLVLLEVEAIAVVVMILIEIYACRQVFYDYLNIA